MFLDYMEFLRRDVYELPLLRFLFGMAQSSLNKIRILCFPVRNIKIKLSENIKMLLQ